MENYSKLKKDLIGWIRVWYDNHANNDNIIVLGMSGGGISNVMAALLCTAIGPRSINAVIMRDEKNKDKDIAAITMANYFGIKHIEIPVYPAINALKNVLNLDCKVRISEQAVKNLPARMRMVTLYSYSQSINGFVVSTQTLSDKFVGHNTLWGDGCGDFAPFANLTREEIYGVGTELGLPLQHIDIEANDELPSSMPDEKKFGFTYKELDTYIRTGIIDSPRSKSLIDKAHALNRFKRMNIDSFNPELYVFEP